MEEYFSGKKLYGDDFSSEQIENWYKEEEEAYANLYGELVSTDQVSGFHNLNSFYGYKYLKKVPSFKNVLGFGASWGFELMPIIERTKKVFIIEASSQTISAKLGNIIPEYRKPNISGKVDFSDNFFDLVTCLSTLHHVPNVTFVLNELFRVLVPGGYMLLREPIHSMGDWRRNREGLTKNERGIPKDYLYSIIKNANMDIIEQNYFYSMTPFLVRNLKLNSFKRTNAYLFLDKIISKLLLFNIHYHALNKLQRCAPSEVYYILRKPV